MPSCSKFGGQIRVAPSLWLGVYIVGFALSSHDGIKKRIVQGFVLNSVYSMDTYHFVHVRKAWGCISYQSSHALQDCLEIAPCGGTLFHPEFVLTAAHCVFHKEFYLRNLSQIYDPFKLIQWKVYLIEEKSHKEAPGDPEGTTRRVPAISYIKEKSHAFYSNFVLLAGSTNYFRMKQKRHAFKVFPYPGYYAEGEERNQTYLSHDVALIQVCEPFEITGTVKPAPMKPLNEMEKHFESIIKRSAACLYVGFGKTRNDTNEKFVRPGYTIPTEFMRYAWRQSSCAARCNFNETRKFDQPRNPCFLCSDHISPRIGTPDQGDSGGPVTCDGYFVAVQSAIYHDVPFNLSLNWAFPLHCIKDAITPERLDYYKTVHPGPELQPLGPVANPVERRRIRKRTDFI